MCLLHSAEHQLIFPDITRYGGARSDSGALGYYHRRHQLRIRTDKHIVADNGLMFIGAVIIAGNGARADIHPGANFGIAEVTQMPGFRPFAKPRFFHLDEITDMSPFSQLGARTQTGERTHGGVSAQFGVFQYAIRTDDYV